MNKKLSTLLLIVVFLGVMIVSQSLQNAYAATGTVTINPTFGPPGTRVTVHVNGFTPSPLTPNHSGDLYPYDILFDGGNFAYPGYTDIFGYVHNPSQPFDYVITIPSWPAPGTTHTINYQHSGLDTSVDAIFTVSGPASKIVFTSGTNQILVANTVSNVITVQLQDSFGTPVNAGPNGVLVHLSSTSTGGKFSATSNFYSSITTITIPSGSNIATFFYKDLLVGSPTLTATVTGLTPATTLFTINLPPLAPPSAPTGVTATALSSSTIKISWTASASATSYDVFRDTSANGPFTTKVNPSPVLSPIIDTGLSSNTQYFYKVKASNAAGTSMLSSPAASATTQKFILTASTTVSDAASCANIGGVYHNPSPTQFNGECTISDMIINSGVTLTVSNSMTLTIIGTITNYGVIINSGGIIFIQATGIIANHGAISNTYGSSIINSGSIINDCGASFNSLGSWANNPVTDLCPKITIITPTNGENVPSHLFGVSGTASAATGITSVTVSMDGGAPFNSGDTTNWLVTMHGSEGPHTITAKVTDTTGHTATASVNITIGGSTLLERITFSMESISEWLNSIFHWRH